MVGGRQIDAPTHNLRSYTTPPVHQNRPHTSSGCTETSKRSRAATLRGLASAFSGSSSKPEQPEPPRMQPLSRPHGTPTGSGGIAALAIPPGALWYFLAREKVHLAQKTSSKGKNLPRGNAFRLHIFRFAAKINHQNPFTNAAKHVKITDGLVNLPRRRAITPTAHFAGWRLP